jgi:hypothetical protein
MSMQVLDTLVVDCDAVNSIDLSVSDDYTNSVYDGESTTTIEWAVSAAAAWSRQGSGQPKAHTGAFTVPPLGKFKLEANARRQGKIGFDLGPMDGTFSGSFRYEVVWDAGGFRWVEGEFSELDFSLSLECTALGRGRAEPFFTDDISSGPPSVVVTRVLVGDETTREVQRVRITFPTDCLLSIDGSSLFSLGSSYWGIEYPRVGGGDGQTRIKVSGVWQEHDGLVYLPTGCETGVVAYDTHSVEIQVRFPAPGPQDLLEYEFDLGEFDELIFPKRLTPPADPYGWSGVAEGTFRVTDSDNGSGGIYLPVGSLIGTFRLLWDASGAALPTGPLDLSGASWVTAAFGGHGPGPGGTVTLS